MIKQLFIISSLTLVAYCQLSQYQPSQPRYSNAPAAPSSPSSSGQYRPSSQYSSGSLSQPQYSYATTTTPRPGPNHPPAPVHYVNIGADLAGDYKFGYDTGKGPAGQSFREESRAPDGTVRGAYGYTDANGQQRIIKYSAGLEGFKIEDDSPAPASGSSGSSGSAPRAAPRPAPAYRAPAPAYTPPAANPVSLSYSQPAPQVSYAQPAPQTTYQQPAPQTYRVPSTQQTLRQALPQSAGYSYSALNNPSAGLALPASYTSSGAALSSSSQPSGYSSSAALQAYARQTASAPTLSLPQAYRSAPAPAPAAAAPSALRSYNTATTSKPEEETWGPPVINTALLNYDIGAGR